MARVIGVWYNIFGIWNNTHFRRCRRMNRREFMVAAAGAAVAGAVRAEGAVGGEARSVQGRNRRPYQGVDWTSAIQIRGTTHVHCTKQADLDAVLKHVEFLTLSNYYPSAPWYPLSKMTENYWRVHHDFPVVVNGRRKDGPFDWNAIVGKWISELPAEMQRQYPFKEGGKLFGPLPEGVLEAPNAEHHAFLMENGRNHGHLHMNSPGSLFASGTFDQNQKNRFQTGTRGGYHFGSGEFWKTAVDRMIEGLIYPDGGGVTINHPSWSGYERGLLLRLLDYDPRVLGIEVLEAGVNSEAYWDWILATGRQCFGFFVPDHKIRPANGAFGVNVLVTEERTAHACLKAYREGNFYGAKRGLNELRFTRIAFEGTTVEAETDKPADFKVITANGVVKEAKGATSIKWEMEGRSGWCGPRESFHVFARVKASAVGGSGEELFSQPMMLVPGVC